ncbi:YybH family protein [Pontibacter mangrovi]|uniref:DUF4440 domain-containing protein n=1 Tax=Pontibacter mangrovi TaxID=2589816 RepID=A0A501W2S8_9BACT|nr:DUF4440 domain-containing protein [Pontibacter mangrovi]TPE44223.1 DUF4440 domain-containing protein [Pontibacter mangrovi]
METKVNLREEIRNAYNKLEGAFTKGNVTGVDSIYVENAELLAPGHDVAKGKSAILKYWQGIVDMGIRKVELNTDKVEDHNDLAVETGTYRMYAQANQQIDQGKYIVLWKHTDGKMLVERGIWNSSNPESLQFLTSRIPQHR